MYNVSKGRVGGGIFFSLREYLTIGTYMCLMTAILRGSKDIFEGRGGPRDNFISRVPGTEVVYYILVCEL